MMISWTNTIKVKIKVGTEVDVPCQSNSTPTPGCMKWASPMEGKR